MRDDGRMEMAKMEVVRVACCFEMEAPLTIAIAVGRLLRRQ